MAMLTSSDLLEISSQVITELELIYQDKPVPFSEFLRLIFKHRETEIRDEIDDLRSNLHKTEFQKALLQFYQTYFFLNQIAR